MVLKLSIALIIITLIVVFFVNRAVTASHTKKAVTYPPSILFNNNKWVLFSAEKEAFKRDLPENLQPIAKGFDLTEEDLKAAHKIVSLKLQKDHPDTLKKVETYYIQFSGFLINEHKYIYASYSCDRNGGDDWQNREYFALDGGDCYFKTTINLSTNEIIAFYMNRN